MLSLPEKDRCKSSGATDKVSCRWGSSAHLKRKLQSQTTKARFGNGSDSKCRSQVSRLEPIDPEYSVIQLDTTTANCENLTLIGQQKFEQVTKS